MRSTAGCNSGRAALPRSRCHAGREYRRSIGFTTVHALQAVYCLGTAAHCLCVVSERYSRIGVTGEFRDEANLGAIGLE